MVIFQVKGAKENQGIMELGEWAKNHDFTGSLVRREYLSTDDKVLESDHEFTKEQIKLGKNTKTKVHRNLYDKKTGNLVEVKDTYLIHYNQSERSHLEAYQATFNGEHNKIKLKLKFLFDQYLFILEHVIDFIGSNRMLDWIDEDYIEEMLEITASYDDGEVHGITRGENDFNVYVIDQTTGDTRIIDIELSDFFDHYIGFEVVGVYDPSESQ